MPSTNLRLVPFEPAASRAKGRATAPRKKRKPLGQILVEMGALSPEDLAMAVSLQAREDARFGDILLTNGWVRSA